MHVFFPCRKPILDELPNACRSVAGLIERFMQESEEYLKNLSRYVDSNSILVISSEGELKRIFCPFIVAAKFKIYRFNEGAILVVDAVKVTLTLQDVFIIEGKAYLVQHFRIIG